MAKTKLIKKKWWPVYAREFENTFVGELYCRNPEDMKGKYALINLSLLTKNYNDQHFNIKLLIDKIEEEKGIATIYGCYMHQAYERRVVTKRKTKISDSFGVKTKDNELIIVKPLLVTISRTNKSVASKIRKFARYFYAEKARKMNSSEFMISIIKGELKSELKKKVSKIMPLSVSEIKKIQRAEKFGLIINPEELKQELKDFKI